ncbi:MAG: signal peptidase II [Bacillota bacterium]
MKTKCFLLPKWKSGYAWSSLFFFTVALLVFILDQGSKFWVVRHLAPGETWPLLGNLLFLTYVRNPGAAFGIFAYKTPFFIAISFVMIILMVIAAHILPLRHLLLRCGLAVLLGGVVGNLYDRLQTGFVVDFLDLRFWPVFNLADVAIVVGVFMVVIGLSRRFGPFEQADPDQGGG